MFFSLPHEFNGFHSTDEGVVHVSMMLPKGGGLVSVCGSINHWSEMSMVNQTPGTGQMCKACKRRLPTFAVREFRSHFQVVEIMTGRTRSMGDGVDVLEGMTPGDENFRKLWEEELNRDAVSTKEAYFPD